MGNNSLDSRMAHLAKNPAWWDIKTKALYFILFLAALMVFPAILVGFPMEWYVIDSTPHVGAINSTIAPGNLPNRRFSVRVANCVCVVDDGSALL